MLCRFSVAPWEPEVFVTSWASQARNRFYVRGLGFLPHCGIRVLYLVLCSLSHIWCVTCSVPSCPTYTHTWLGTIHSPLCIFSVFPPQVGGDPTSFQACYESGLWPKFRAQSLTAFSLPLPISRPRVQQHCNASVCSLLSVSILFCCLEIFGLCWVQMWLLIFEI